VAGDTTGYGVFGYNYATSGYPTGVLGLTFAPGGYGCVFGSAGTILYGYNSSSYNTEFHVDASGNQCTAGNLSAGGSGSFKGLPDNTGNGSPVQEGPRITRPDLLAQECRASAEREDMEPMASMVMAASPQYRILLLRASVVSVRTSLSRARRVMGCLAPEESALQRKIGGTRVVAYGGYSNAPNTEGGVGLEAAGGELAVSGQTGDGIHAYPGPLAGVGSVGLAGHFFGDVAVDGNPSKAGGSFKIDHPLNPADKYPLSLFRRIARHEEHLRRYCHRRRKWSGRSASPVVRRIERRLSLSVDLHR
jgi:hypothetical protein